MPSRLRLLAPLLLVFAALGAGPCATGPIRIGLPTAGGQLPVQITLSASADPGAVTVTLDGADVTALFAPGAPGLVGAIPVPAPGSHQIQVTGQLAPLVPLPIGAGLVFQSPGAAPALVDTTPPGGGSVPRTAWLRFGFASAPSASALAGFGFALECNGTPARAHRARAGGRHADPEPDARATGRRELPRRLARRRRRRRASTASAWPRTPPAATRRRTTTAAIRCACRPSPTTTTPTTTPRRPTGLTIEPPVPPFNDPFQQEVFTALTTAVGPIDGWSRQSPIVLSFSHPLDASAVPANGARGARTRSRRSR